VQDVEIFAVDQPLDVVLTPKFAFPNSLNGVVSVGSSGDPINDALVTVEEAIGVLSFGLETYKDGAFAVNVPQDGEYVVDTSAAGFAGEIKSVVVSPTMPSGTVEFALSVDASGEGEGEGPAPVCGALWRDGAPINKVGDAPILLLSGTALIALRNRSSGVRIRK
jgi:hypothetical protein